MANTLSYLHFPLPVVLIPEKHTDTVDDVGLVELDSDPLAPVSGDGVSGVAIFTGVVLCVSIEQGLLRLPLYGACNTMGSGYILLWN